MRNTKPVLCLLILLLATSETTNADTLARSFPLSQQMMITVFKPRMGGSDSDGQTLWAAMNVPVQGSLMGPSKSIESATRSFSWVCGDRGADGIQCTLMIQKGVGTQIRLNPAKAKFEATGSDSAALFQLVNPNTAEPNTAEGAFRFTNAEGTLSLSARPDHFVMSYEE